MPELLTLLFPTQHYEAQQLLQMERSNDGEKAEFGVFLPVMLALFFNGSESAMGYAFSCNMKPRNAFYMLKEAVRWLRTGCAK